VSPLIPRPKRQGQAIHMACSLPFYMKDHFCFPLKISTRIQQWRVKLFSSFLHIIISCTLESVPSQDHSYHSKPIKCHLNEQGFAVSYLGNIYVEYPFRLWVIWLLKRQKKKKKIELGIKQRLDLWNLMAWFNFSCFLRGLWT